jgi:hypothetical protein
MLELERVTTQLDPVNGRSSPAAKSHDRPLDPWSATVRKHVLPLQTGLAGTGRTF